MLIAFDKRVRDSFRHTPPEFTQPLVMGVFAGVIYNALLAAANAAGVVQTFATASSAEALILTYTGLTLIGRVEMGDFAPLSLIVFAGFVSVLISIENQTLYFDCLRNLTIIGLFYMIGRRLSEADVVFVFNTVSLWVAAILAIELLSTPLYVAIFQPASYYFNTRGIEAFSLDTTGLFRNALGFEERFSFGVSDHRTASLFLDQVSLANFADVLCMFLSSFFRRISLRTRVFQLALVICIMVTNDSRTTLMFAAISTIGYFAYPKMRQELVYMVGPSIFACGAIEFWVFGDTGGDDLVGRVAITMNHFLDFGAPDVLGLRIDRISEYMDSGYAYVVSSMTLVGLAAVWLFCGRAIGDGSASRRRCAFSLNLFMFLNLMIGGTAVFSIKIASMLWVLVGYMSSSRNPSSVSKVPA